jgi:uncharacterized membrane protein YqjE
VDEQQGLESAMAQEQAERCTVTLRAICIGAALIPALCMWVIQAEILWYSCQPTTVSLMPHVVFILFFLTLGNLLIKRWWPATALNPGELLTIYVMLTVGSVACGHDFIQILVPMITYAYQGATPESGWEKFHQYLPSFVTMNQREIYRGFYEGGSSMYRWEVIAAWGKPMLWWATFIFALVSSLFLINVLLRRQWTENEKLSYPVIQIPLMVATEPRSLLRNRLMWYGFALAAGIDLLNGLASFFPALPQIPIVHISNLRDYLTERPWNAVGQMWFSLYPFAIGVCFFLPVDLAFSCWFFFILWQLQRVLSSAFGVTIPGFPFVNDQTAGGYLGLCLIALWVSRRYLRDVFAHVFVRKRLDERDEALPYRVAFMLLLACLAYVGLFLYWLRMPLWMIVPFLLGYFAIAVAIARMRAELGPPAHDLHYAGPDQMMPRFFGMGSLGPQTLTTLTLTWFFNRAYRGQPIAPSLEGFKIAQQTRMSSRLMLAAMVVALVLGIFGGFWAMLHVGYKYGMEASAIGPGAYFGREPFSRLNGWVANPEKANTGATIATGVGVASTLGLAAMRMRFAWWPFHPVGYAVSGSWSMEQLWFPMFISWLLKWVILHYGGARAYRRAVPLFVGLVLGEFVVGNYWTLHGVVFGVPTYDFWPY